MLPTAERLHKSKAPTGEKSPPSGASMHLAVARQSAPLSYQNRELRYASSRILIRTPTFCGDPPGRVRSDRQVLAL